MQLLILFPATKFPYLCAMLVIIGYSCAFLMGIILGLMGGGGSILTVPVLVYLIGMPPEIAPSHSLFVVGVSAVVGTLRYLRQGKVSPKTGLIFALPSMAGVHVSQYFILPAIPAVLFSTENFKLSKGMGIMLLFSVLLVLAAWNMVRRKNRQTPDEPTGAISPVPLMIVGLSVGLFTGLVGAGGGFMIVPALLLLAKMQPKEAVGTSLLIIAANSLTGFVSALLAGAVIDWKLLGIFTGIAIAGIFAGVAVHKYIPANRLKVVFGWFTLVMAAVILSKTLWDGL